MDLTQRQERVLSCVVAGYSRTGEPVGSKAVAQELGVSSATVRNEMAGLIELGLLEQPHTSAGRVPSQRGYREYVDRLMPPWPLEEGEKREMDSALLGSAYDQEALLILLSSAGTMKTRVFRCDFDLTPELIQLYFRVFNQRVAGREVAGITPAFAQSMAASLGEMYVLLGPPLQALLEAARDTACTQVLVNGQLNLLLYPELGHRGIRRVLDFLERGEGLAGLLAAKPGRVKVLIGKEAGYDELEDLTLAVARYKVAGQDAGSIGTVGPVRTDYPKLTAVLEYLSGQVGRMLTGLMAEGQE